jgi:hypothetical protein
MAVMLVALRALRFCYSSNILSEESLLYKDWWNKSKEGRIVKVEGFGRRKSVELCGLGWFFPKFNWTTLRIKPPHGDNMLEGCLLNHPEYKRRWQALKDLQNVYIRFNQAEQWLSQYNIKEHPRLLTKWYEYLFALNLEQFDADVWKTMLRAHNQTPQLSPQALRQEGRVVYSYDDMKHLFLNNNVVSPPHIATGNKGQFNSTGDLLGFLFLPDERKRTGWQFKPYRQILQRTYELLAQEFDARRANLWVDQFFYLVRLTHWILPWPTDTALIGSTKTSRKLRLSRKLMWYSAVFTHPAIENLGFSKEAADRLRLHEPVTLAQLKWRAHQRSQRPGSEHDPWDVFELIKYTRKLGVGVPGIDEAVDHWTRGRKPNGKQGFLPAWERGRPPLLQMQERIRGLSLDELEIMMVEWVQEHSIPVQAAVSHASSRARDDACHSQISNSRASSTQVGGASSSIGRETGSVYVLSEQST